MRIRDEEHMLVRRAFERDAAQLTHGAARAVASPDPPGRDFVDGAVRVLERCRDVPGILRQADQLRVPLHGHAPVAEGVAQQPFVVVLAEDQEKGIRAQIAPDVT